MSKVLISTFPFGDKDRTPIERLNAAKIPYIINPLGRKLKEDELVELASDVDVLIAGTEPITKHVMAQTKRLKFISRVGVGLDSVDLTEAAERGIKVSYTPDAPAPAVAELTLGLILSALRSVHVANGQMHRDEWERHFGRRIAEITIGIIGVGRIGSRVLRLLSSFGPRRILANDLRPDLRLSSEFNFQWTDKETIYREADAITLHIPLTEATKNMICRRQLLCMKTDTILINTARGGIVNEEDLAEVMRSGHLSGAAVDVFSEEPYSGELNRIERCLLTSHMGSMTIDCRTRMEIEATDEAIRFLTGQPLISQVPTSEYDMRRKVL